MAEEPPPQSPLPSEAAVLMASLLHLNTHQFSQLRLSVASDLRRQRYRLHSLLLSASSFSHTLAYVRSLSLSDKTTLLARLLLRPLHHFAAAVDPRTPRSSARVTATSLRDLDAAVLLMAMCDSYDQDGDGCRHHSGSDEDWRRRITAHLMGTLLSPAGLGGGAAMEVGVDVGAKCRRILAAVEGEEKGGRETGAAVAAVVLLESVEMGGGGGGCGVCREEMEEGRDVCGMPCGHRFHWGCILSWLRQRNTCPYCRFELPSDDVFCEIGRLWRLVEAADRRCRFHKHFVN